MQERETEHVSMHVCLFPPFSPTQPLHGVPSVCLICADVTNSQAGDCVTACKEAETKREASKEYQSHRDQTWHRDQTSRGLEGEMNFGSRTHQEVKAIEISSGHSSPGAGICVVHAHAYTDAR